MGLDGQDSVPGRGKEFVSSRQRPDRPPVQWVRGALTPGVKRPGREANHSPPSSTEVKNGGVTPPLPNMSSRRGA
jgi:hypothetical protein